MNDWAPFTRVVLPACNASKSQKGAARAGVQSSNRSEIFQTETASISRAGTEEKQRWIVVLVLSVSVDLHTTEFLCNLVKRKKERKKEKKNRQKKRWAQKIKLGWWRLVRKVRSLASPAQVPRPPGKAQSPKRHVLSPRLDERFRNRDACPPPFVIPALHAMQAFGWLCFLHSSGSCTCGTGCNEPRNAPACSSCC